MLERIIKQRGQLVLSHPFFGALALRLKLVEDSGCKTFWVDGKSLGYNPQFVATLDDLELRGAMAHEVLHPASGHCWRRGNRDQDLWNEACDYAINPVVLAAKLKLPKGVLLDDRFAGKSADEIYAVLRQERKPKPPQEPKSGEAGGAEAGQSLPGASSPNGEQEEGSAAGTDSGDAPAYSPGDIRQDRSSDKALTESQWKVAAVKAAMVAKARGKFGADLQAVVDELVTPAVDWRSALARFASESAQADYSWAMPNRRFTHLGLYLPALHSRRVGDAVFVRDSSGSVFDETQRQFASEIHRVFDEVKPSRLIVIDCDARVTQIQVFEPGDKLDLAPVKGGGGTCFAPPFEWVEEQGFRPAFLAYLTDMYGAFPELPPEYPVLWASTTPLRRIHTPPFGDCIEVIV
ncbi:DUF2201 family putative metallopeptidase [Ralstonia pseudosolanacearum]|uniref:vWA domain-containing protein n=1 Tax=Ralstonia pseudosolanacearum TaxID=1310165 RepID=UPI003CF8CD28